MFESAAKGYEGYLERFPRSKARLRGAVLRRRVPVQLAAVRQGGEELRRHPRQRLGRPVSEGRRLRRGARLEQAHRAAARAEEARQVPGAPQQGPPRGREAAGHPAGAGGEVAHRRHRRLPPALAQGRARPGRRLPRRRAALRPQRVPRRAPALRGDHQDLPEERGRQVRHQPHGGDLPHRQGLAERGGGLRPPGPEHRGHRPRRASSTRTWSSSSSPAGSSSPTS